MEGGPPCFRRDSACPAVLPDSCASPASFPYGTLALCGGPFQWPSGKRRISDSLRGAAAPAPGPSNPDRPSPAGCASRPVSAPPVSFATTPGIVSLPRGTQMFHFPRCPSPGLCVQPGMTEYHLRRVAPFGHPRIVACPPLPEAYRRVATSFIGRRRQGIHRVPSTRFSVRPRVVIFLHNQHAPRASPGLPARPTPLACQSSTHRTPGARRM